DNVAPGEPLGGAMSDARWNDPREDDVRDRGDEWQGVYDPRDRDDDPRDVLMRDLDLPRGDERELVVDRDRVYELDGEDSRTLAVVGAFRDVPSGRGPSSRRAPRPRDSTRHSRARPEARIPGVPAGPQPRPSGQRRPTWPRRERGP